MKYWLFFWPLFWEFQWILQSLLTVKKDSERGPESVFSHVWNRQFFCFCFFIFQNWQVTKVFPCYIHLDKLPLLIETATLEELREDQSETFDRLCIELDHSLNGWRALGKNVDFQMKRCRKSRRLLAVQSQPLRNWKQKILTCLYKRFEMSWANWTETMCLKKWSAFQVIYILLSINKKIK